MFRVLAGNTSDYVSCVDRERRILYLSRTLSRDLPNVLGRKTESFVAEQYREEAVRSTEAAFTTGKAQRLEVDVSLAGGSAHCFEIRIVPFRGPADEPLALQITSDLTERRRLVDELSRSEEFRSLIVENLPDFVTLLDRDYRIRWANRMAPGLTREKVIGARLDDFISPSDCPKMHAAVDWVFAEFVLRLFEAR